MRLAARRKEGARAETYHAQKVLLEPEHGIAAALLRSYQFQKYKSGKGSVPLRGAQLPTLLNGHETLFKNLYHWVDHLWLDRLGVGDYPAKSVSQKKKKKDGRMKLSRWGPRDGTY